MAQEEYPTLQGDAPSWADIETDHIIYDGEIVSTKDYQAINWGRTVEVGELRGASGGRVRRRTRGQVSYELTITYYKDGARRMRDGLAATATAKGLVDAQGRPQISRVPFDVLCKHSVDGDPRIHKMLAQGLRWLGETGASTEGVDAETVEVTFSPACIEIDGTVLL
jgi:hypothetical protein